MARDPQAAVATTERRKTRRIGVLGRIDGWVHQLDLRLVVLDISEGGIGVVAAWPLDLGTEHDLTLTGRDLEPAEVRVRVTHCRPAKSPTGGGYFVLGLCAIGSTSSYRRMTEALTSEMPFRPH